MVVDGTEIGEKLLPKFSKEELIGGFLVLLILLAAAIILALPAILVVAILLLPLGFLGIGIPLLIGYSKLYAKVQHQTLQIGILIRTTQPHEETTSMR
mgnify:CR=1 FL=1